MSTSVPYIPGTQITQPDPLNRFLPPLPEGVVSEWLKRNLPRSNREDGGNPNPNTNLVLDPFCAAPRVAIEAANAGYRVLVAANNPITRFILMVTARPPSKSELRSAVAKLGAARKGEDRLEPHIRSLYMTTCDACDNQVMADAFVWEHHEESDSDDKLGKASLIAKIYNCPHCGEGGQFPINTADSALAKEFPAKGLHHARALERVTPIDDPDRKSVAEALETYLPRAIYALFTIINNLDAIDLTDQDRDYLKALLLTTLDKTNNLWTYPSGRHRPRRLSASPRFYEHNVWLALENSIDLWSSSKIQHPLTIWPELPPQGGGICIFEGRLKLLVESLKDQKVSAVITAIPRPNQAFWTLSALWAGWLLGKETVAPFKSVLHRRRYDWGWHATALRATFSELSRVLNPETPYLGIIGETEPGFISAALIAADMANFNLTGLAMRSAGDLSQINWRLADPKQETNKFVRSDWPTIAQEAAIDHIKSRGEPVDYLDLHTAVISALATESAFKMYEKPTDNLSKVSLLMDDVFSSPQTFRRLGGSEKSIEVGKYWLHEDDNTNPPLSDRVEIAIVNHLLQKSASTLLEIDMAICHHFPGLLTPNAELLQVCLSSYGQKSPVDHKTWQIRPGDLPDVRRKDIFDISQALAKLGDSLGYNVVGDKPIRWISKVDSRTRYAFYIIASAIIGDIVFRSEYNPEISLIVLPGSRANLVAYKLANNSRLKSVIKGWRFMKFRLVRWMGENPVLNQIAFEEHIAKETLTYESPQLRLL